MAGDEYRQVATFDLRPVYTSLGLPRASFKNKGRAGAKVFDAALNADPSQPDAVWLFKGSEYYRFNVSAQQNKFEQDAKIIAGNFGGQTWPILFSTGIDAATWAGPAYPYLWYFFKEDQFIRLNSSSGGSWIVDQGPSPIAEGWFSARGTWFSKGCDAALHGLGERHKAKLHLFRDGEYMRHNLNDGHQDIGPVPIAEKWALPEAFCNKIDFAFYGTGAEEQHIFFVCGDEVAQYDAVHDEVINISPIEKRFSPFAQFISRPQLFLVENYSLQTYVGPPVNGRLVDTKNVPPGVKIKTLMVTETTTVTDQEYHQSIIESQDASVVNNFNEQLDSRVDTAESREGYKYQMNADFHGEAEANSLWGGEVNASLGVQGSTDSQRSNLAQSTFKTIGSQVTASTRQLNQRTYDSVESISQTVKVLKQEEIELNNPTDKLRSFEFYQQLQPTYAILALKDVQVAYGDGSGGGFTTSKLSGLKDLLDEKLITDQSNQVAGFITREMSAVEVSDGSVVSLLASEAPLSLKVNPTATFTIQLADGSKQDLVVRALAIKAAKEWLTPTYTIVAIQKTS